MREGASAEQLAKAVRWEPMVSSWLGGQVLADHIPIIRGRATGTTRQKVQSELRITVPPTSVENGRLRRWRPDAPEHALAKNGQVLDVSLNVEGTLIRIGRYKVHDWKENGDGSIDVWGKGMLHDIDEDRLQAATGPRDDGTLRSEFARLTPSYMSAQFDPTLVDRECPKAMEWPKERLDALYEIADAWPARLREDAWGGIRILPPLPDAPIPLISLHDGPDGTLIAAPLSDTREGAPNVFVVTSSADGVEAQAIVSIDNGPMSAAGEYHPVPEFFSSPLLRDEADCLAAALTHRAESLRRTKIRSATLAPDPRIELDDPIELIIGYETDEQVTAWGYVVGFDLPLTPRDGEMQADVAVF
ncbi:hypothetical protein MicroSTF_14010 [Microbacterium sp. STF-2]|uniref:hypothetical protein n=1 Tax=Microbacterium sp. STF-2 TaxID=3031132 RepID=UPI002AFF7FA4|nr:hypothetical protein [Microbacterium sp. STF-2]MEA1264153.1 hypothetical protein [Microbacterium sp. STF-2]